MPENKLHILGINPGTKYTGFAVFEGPELRDWGIKSFKGPWSKAKMKRIVKVISGQVHKYGINILVIKMLHPARCSANLKKLVIEIKNYSQRKGLKNFSYSIQELETNFSPKQKINKKALAEIIALEYPALFHDLKKERKNKNPYFIKVFEAVALGGAYYFEHEK